MGESGRKGAKDEGREIRKETKEDGKEKAPLPIFPTRTLKDLL